MFVYPPQWLPDPLVWSNYADVVRVMPFLRYVCNTTFVAGSVTLLQLVVSSLAAFAFARLRFPGRDRLFLAYLATLMVPGQVTLIPDFPHRQVSWLDRHVPGADRSAGLQRVRHIPAASVLPDHSARARRCRPHRRRFGVRAFFARFCYRFRRTALATLGVFTFTAQWNSFLWPLIVINDVQMRTLTVGLRALVGQYTVQYPLLMAGSVIALVPMVVVFLLAQRAFVRGIALTGLGGR